MPRFRTLLAAALLAASPAFARTAPPPVMGRPAPPAAVARPVAPPVVVSRPAPAPTPDVTTPMLLGAATGAIVASTLSSSHEPAQAQASEDDGSEAGFILLFALLIFCMAWMVVFSLP